MPGANEQDGSADHAHWPQTLGVVGVGLLGGSVALAAKRANPDVRVIGVGRSLYRLQQAAEAGVLDEPAADVDAVSAADLVVVCTPVDRVAADVTSALKHVSDDAVVTDVGSTKATIITACGDRPRFVGSHPMAGSEKTGWRHASADLFDRRTCVVTPGPASEVSAVDRVDAFWRSLGSRTVRMDAASHDVAVARVSHLPHFAAAAVVAAAGEATELAAGGFADTTRVAAGDPALWTAIARENAGPVSAALEDLSRRLLAMKTAVDLGQWDAFEAMLDKAATLRRSLDERAPR